MSVEFSVIINTFQRNNREIDFKRSLDSIMNQTFEPKQLIIVNSGREKLDIKFFLENAKIKYEIINCGENINIPRKRNIAAKVARFQYLAFLDDDDYWNKNYLLDSSKLIKNENPQVILSDVYTEVDNKLKIFRSPSSNNYKDYLLSNPGAMGSNIIIKKEIFDLVGGYDENLYVSEDKSIIIDLILKNIKIHFQNNVVVYNLTNPNSISKNFYSLIKGMTPFYFKYKHIMSLKEKIFFLKKLYSYKRKLNKIYLINFIFFVVIEKIFFNNEQN